VKSAGTRPTKTPVAPPTMAPLAAPAVPSANAPAPALVAVTCTHRSAAAPVTASPTAFARTRVRSTEACAVSRTRRVVLCTAATGLATRRS